MRDRQSQSRLCCAPRCAASRHPVWPADYRLSLAGSLSSGPRRKRRGVDAPWFPLSTTLPPTSAIVAGFTWWLFHSRVKLIMRASERVCLPLLITLKGACYHPKSNPGRDNLIKYKIPSVHAFSWKSSLEESVESVSSCGRVIDPLNLQSLSCLKMTVTSTTVLIILLGNVTVTFFTTKSILYINHHSTSKK